MGVFFNQPTPLYCDNKSTIQITHDSVFHEPTKHIEIDYHVIRHHYQLGTITLSFIFFSIQIADIFTKMLSASRFRFLFGTLNATYSRIVSF